VRGGTPSASWRVNALPRPTENVRRRDPRARRRSGEKIPEQHLLCSQTTRRESNRQPRCGSTSVLVSGELWGRRGPNGSGKGKRRSSESSARRRSVKRRRGPLQYAPSPASPCRRSLALQSLTAALHGAVARSFRGRATAHPRPVRGGRLRTGSGQLRVFTGKCMGVCAPTLVPAGARPSETSQVRPTVLASDVQTARKAVR